MKYEVALQWRPKCTQCTVHCPAPATGAAVSSACRRALTAVGVGGAVVRVYTRKLEFRRLVAGALASTSCNNYVADLVFLSEVPHATPPLPLLAC
jgi:hypothetical protein